MQRMNWCQGKQTDDHKHEISFLSEIFSLQNPGFKSAANVSAAHRDKRNNLQLQRESSELTPCKTLHNGEVENLAQSGQFWKVISLQIFAKTISHRAFWTPQNLLDKRMAN